MENILTTVKDLANFIMNFWIVEIEKLQHDGERPFSLGGSKENVMASFVANHLRSEEVKKGFVFNESQKKLLEKRMFAYVNRKMVSTEYCKNIPTTMSAYSQPYGGDFQEIFKDLDIPSSILPFEKSLSYTDDNTIGSIVDGVIHIKDDDTDYDNIDWDAYDKAQKSRKTWTGYLSEYVRGTNHTKYKIIARVEIQL